MIFCDNTFSHPFKGIFARNTAKSSDLISKRSGHRIWSGWSGLKINKNDALYPSSLLLSWPQTRVRGRLDILHIHFLLGSTFMHNDSVGLADRKRLSWLFSPNTENSDTRMRSSLLTRQSKKNSPVGPKDFSFLSPSISSPKYVVVSSLDSSASRAPINLEMLSGMIGILWISNHAPFTGPLESSDYMTPSCDYSLIFLGTPS